MVNHRKMPCYLMALVALAQGAGALEAGNIMKGAARTYPVWEGGAQEAPAQKGTGVPDDVPALMDTGARPAMGAADPPAKTRRQIERCRQKNRNRRQAATQERQRQRIAREAADLRRAGSLAEPCPGTPEAAREAAAPKPRRSPGSLGRLVAFAGTMAAYCTSALAGETVLAPESPEEVCPRWDLVLEPKGAGLIRYVPQWLKCCGAIGDFFHRSLSTLDLTEVIGQPTAFLPLSEAYMSVTVGGKVKGHRAEEECLSAPKD